MGLYLCKPNKTKYVESGETAQLAFAVTSMQGWRKTLEDSWFARPSFEENFSLFGLFDGHGGPEIAQFCSKYMPPDLAQNTKLSLGNYKEALEETFIHMDALLLQERGQILLKEFNKGYSTGLLSGCTAILALITPTDIYIANAGDSKALLLKQSGEVVSLSTEHLPSIKSERKRIKDAGGYITEQRVNDILNLTRAIGDLQFKQNSLLSLKDQIITSFPDVVQVPRAEAKLLALGTDGVWERFGHQEIFERFEREMGQGDPPQMLASLASLFNANLADNTMDGVGCDNMTCVLVRFK